MTILDTILEQDKAFKATEDECQKRIVKVEDIIKNWNAGLMTGGECIKMIVHEVTS